MSIYLSEDDIEIIKKLIGEKASLQLEGFLAAKRMEASARAGPVVPELVAVPKSDAQSGKVPRANRQGNGARDNDSDISNVSQPKRTGNGAARKAKGKATRNNPKRFKSDDGVLGIVTETDRDSKGKLF